MPSFLNFVISQEQKKLEGKSNNVLCSLSQHNTSAVIVLRPNSSSAKLEINDMRTLNSRCKNAEKVLYDIFSQSPAKNTGLKLSYRTVPVQLR